MKSITISISAVLTLLTVSCGKGGLPQVETVDYDIVTSQSVILVGEVVSEAGAAITHRGFYWGTNPNPTFSDNYTDNSFGPGVFTARVVGLVYDTVYYFRSFAVNENGTAYGRVISFKTTLPETGILTDARDGRDYPTVRIGDQVWMARNLAYLPSVASGYSNSETQPFFYVFNYYGTNLSSARNDPYYLTYGTLYNWPAAMSGDSSSNTDPSRVTGICPDGWHLPSDVEWTALTDFLGPDAGKVMKDHRNWDFNADGNNLSGFNALPGGSLTRSGGFTGFTAFWTSTSNASPDAWYRSLYNTGGVTRDNNSKALGFYVRCMKDSVHIDILRSPTADFNVNPKQGNTSTIFQFDASASSDVETESGKLEVRWDWDGDGTWDTYYSRTKTRSHQFDSLGSYQVTLEVMDDDGLVDTRTITVKVCSTFIDNRDNREYVFNTIGTQTWMIENLAYLPAVSPPPEGSETSPFYYVFDYAGSSIAEAKATANYIVYGVLYNWEAAKTACPPGWHLPSDAEWTVLTDYLGSSPGGKMKEAGVEHWLFPNQGATNASSFTALPGGYRYNTGRMYYLGKNANFWSGTKNSPANAWYRNLDYQYDDLSRRQGVLSYGYSVRCVRD